MTKTKAPVPAHLKTKTTTTKFLQYLQTQNRWYDFVQSYQQGRVVRKSMLQACNDAIDTVFGRLTFVWFGDEQLHRIHLDPHLILPELQQL